MINIQRFDHIGIRVTDARAALDFYAKFGFEKTYEDPDDPVLVLRNPAGVELNLVVNGTKYDDGNILMDGASKYPGYTHLALRVEDLEQTIAALDEEGIEIREGPVVLGESVAIFIRDPDLNVIELNAPAADWSH